MLSMYSSSRSNRYLLINLPKHYRSYHRISSNYHYYNINNRCSYSNNSSSNNNNSYISSSNIWNSGNSGRNFCSNTTNYSRNGNNNSISNNDSISSGNSGGAGAGNRKGNIQQEYKLCQQQLKALQSLVIASNLSLSSSLPNSLSSSSSLPNSLSSSSSSNVSSSNVTSSLYSSIDALLSQIHSLCHHYPHEKISVLLSETSGISLRYYQSHYYYNYSMMEYGTHPHLAHSSNSNANNNINNSSNSSNNRSIVIGNEVVLPRLQDVMDAVSLCYHCLQCIRSLNNNNITYHSGNNSNGSAVTSNGYNRLLHGSLNPQITLFLNRTRANTISLLEIATNMLRVIGTEQYSHHQQQRNASVIPISSSSSLSHIEELGALLSILRDISHLGSLPDDILDGFIDNIQYRLHVCVDNAISNRSDDLSDGTTALDKDMDKISDVNTSPISRNELFSIYSGIRGLSSNNRMVRQLIQRAAELTQLSNCEWDKELIETIFECLSRFSCSHTPVRQLLLVLADKIFMPIDYACLDDDDEQLEKELIATSSNSSASARRAPRRGAMIAPNDSAKLIGGKLGTSFTSDITPAVLLTVASHMRSMPSSVLEVRLLLRSLDAAIGLLSHRQREQSGNSLSALGRILARPNFSELSLMDALAILPIMEYKNSDYREVRVICDHVCNALLSAILRHKQNSRGISYPSLIQASSASSDITLKIDWSDILSAGGWLQHANFDHREILQLLSAYTQAVDLVAFGELSSIPLSSKGTEPTIHDSPSKELQTWCRLLGFCHNLEPGHKEVHQFLGLIAKGLKHVHVTQPCSKLTPNQLAQCLNGLANFTIGSKDKDLVSLLTTFHSVVDFASENIIDFNDHAYSRVAARKLLVAKGWPTLTQERYALQTAEAFLGSLLSSTSGSFLEMLNQMIAYMRHIQQIVNEWDAIIGSTKARTPTSVGAPAINPLPPITPSPGIPNNSGVNAASADRDSNVSGSKQKPSESSMLMTRQSLRLVVSEGSSQPNEAEWGYYRLAVAALADIPGVKVLHNVLLSRFEADIVILVSVPALTTNSSNPDDDVYRLVINVELDGEHHANPANKRQNKIRDDAITSTGVHVVRWNVALNSPSSIKLTVNNGCDNIAIARKFRTLVKRYLEELDKVKPAPTKGAAKQSEKGPANGSTKTASVTTAESSK